MKAKLTAIVGILFTIVFLILGLTSLLSWTAAGPLAGASIGITSIIVTITLALERKEEPKKKEKVEQRQLQLREEQEPIVDETVLVEDHISYDLNLNKKEKVYGEIASRGYFNLYFLTPRNLTKFENNEEFTAEYARENVSKTKINFTPNKPGLYHCVIENTEDDSINVKAILHIQRSGN
jgi:hypothetical protein